MKTLRHKSEYKARRAAAYPSIGDQLDAIWKALEALKDTGKLPPETTAVMAEVKAVKDTFKKDK